jgi:cysteine desulfurase
MERICFDHLSGMPVEPPALEAMLPWFSEHFGGTGAVHSGGVEARTALDEAREKVAQFINAASPEEIIFTSSGTEAINLAIKGCAWANQKRGNRIVLSAIEHPAVAQSIEFLQSMGFTKEIVSVSAEGRIDPGAIAKAIDDKTTLVCVHAGNHDLGTIQDLRRIGDAAAEKGIAMLVDATYAAGWMPLDVQAIGASYLAIAPHRFGGPKGIGILYKQRRARLTPLIHGGAQELGWRAGTENVAGIIGTGVACELVGKDLGGRSGHVAALQAQMWNGLKAGVKDIRLNGAPIGPQRLPNTLNFSVAGVEGEGLALSLDMKGIAVTSGQACTTRATKVPATLAAIGVGEDYGPGTLIASFNKENTANQIDQFLQIFPAVVEKLRAINSQDIGGPGRP